MSAWTKAKEFLICRRLVSVLLFLALFLFYFGSFFPVNSLAVEPFSFDNLCVRTRLGKVVNSWVYEHNIGTTLSYTGSNRSLCSFGICVDDNIDELAKIPVSADLSDIYIYARFILESGSPTPGAGEIGVYLSARCYDSSYNEIGVVLREVRSIITSEYLAISGVEFPSGTSYFDVNVGFGGRSASSSSTGLYGIDGKYSCSCAFTVVTGDGSFVSDNWDTDKPYPFLFSHEGQNVYLEKNGRIDVSVLARGFSNLNMTVIARTYTDSTTYILEYFNTFHILLLSAVPPDTDEAAILCFDFYIDGNLVYTSPACAIYFSGWVSGNPGDGSGGSVADGEILDYLEEVKMTQSEANDKLDALQASVEEIPDQMDQAMQNAADKEKNDASSKGSDLVDQLTGVIPDYSEGFTTALTDFASNFSYDGTEAILRIPQIRFPEIPSNRRGAPLVRSFVMLEEQEVDFSEFAAMMPESVLTLVRCLLTVALIIFCFKELYDTISYILTLRKGDN